MLWGFVDVTYLVFLLPAALIALWAQMRLKSTYAKYGQMFNREGLTRPDDPGPERLAAYPD